MAQVAGTNGPGPRLATTPQVHNKYLTRILTNNNNRKDMDDWAAMYTNFMTQLERKRIYRRRTRYQTAASDHQAERVMFSAVGLEGWNRIYFININRTLFQDIKATLEQLWVEGFEQSSCLNCPAESNSPSVSAPETDFLLEFCGHPWDSYKAHSDLSPYLLMVIFEKMRQAGFRFISNVNFRGSLDTLIFMPQPTDSGTETIPRPLAQTYFTLCHQDCVRIYNASGAFCGWVRRLFQQIWAQGVMMEKQLTFTNDTPQRSEAEGEAVEGAERATAEDGDRRDKELGYTEIRLNGSPWWIAEWNKDALLAAKYMLTRFVSVLALTGWQCTASINMYCSPYDKCLLIFEKELVSDEEQTTVDLELIELQENTSNKLCRPIDLLIPVCITTYDTDQICILGGSKNFLRYLHMRFSNLFGSSKYLNDRIELSLKDREPSDFGFKDWMPSKSYFAPEAVHCILFEEKLLLCLMKPPERATLPTPSTALISINDSDPDSSLEYGLNYQPWDGLMHWPNTTYKKASDKRINQYIRSQLPLSLLCWIHELVVTTPAAPSTPTGGNMEEQDVIDKISDPLLKQKSDSKLFLCTDCSSVTKNSPPTWIYLVRERKYNLVHGSGNAGVNV
nr:unnamed protein product [Spirometra erinaceieuropaei]